jgi:hypothetical protein
MDSFYNNTQLQSLTMTKRKREEKITTDSNSLEVENLFTNSTTTVKKRSTPLITSKYIDTNCQQIDPKLLNNDDDYNQLYLSNKLSSSLSTTTAADSFLGNIFYGF